MFPAPHANRRTASKRQRVVHEDDSDDFVDDGDLGQLDDGESSIPSRSYHGIANTAASA